jgi:hypothetical protein
MTVPEAFLLISEPHYLYPNAVDQKHANPFHSQLKLCSFAISKLVA